MSRDGLPAAKISAPRSSMALPRRRLFAALDRARRCRVVWVTGPAGSGKTTLVSSYLQHRRIRALWYRVDRLDCDRARIFHYLGRGLETMGRRRRVDLPKASHQPNLFTEFPLRYFEEFFRLVPPGSALVLDDYQEGPSAAHWDQLILDAARAVQPPTNIIVVSRKEPSKTWIRQAFEQELSVIEGAALQLTESEAVALAKRRRPRQTARGLREAIAGIHRATGGWVAPFVLFLESLSAGENRAPTLGAAEHVFDYIAAEVFERLDAGVQEALLKTAFLPELTPSLADELFDTQLLGRALLRPLGLRPLLERRDDTGTGEVVYRYHPLFRAFLLHRAKATLSKEQITDLQCRAARLLVAAGRPDEAVDLFHKAGDWEQIGLIARAEAPGLISRGQNRTLAQWLGFIPPPRLRQDAWLLYWSGVCHLASDPKAALEVLEQAHTLFATAHDRSGTKLAWAACVRAIVLESSDFRVLDAWIARAPEPDGVQEGGAPEAHFLAAMTLALSYRGRVVEAKPWVERGIALARRIEDSNLSMMLMGQALSHCAIEGDLELASSLLVTLTALSQGQAVDPLVRIVAKFGEAMYAYFSGDERAALRAVREGLAIARQAGASHLSDRMLVYGVLSAIGLGDRAAAEAFVEQLARRASSGGKFDVASHQYACGLLALFRGDFQRAASCARAALALVTEIDMPFIRQSATLVSVRASFASGDYEAGHACLEQLRRLQEAAPSRVYVYYRFLFEAELALREGPKAEGLAMIARAFGAGRSIGVYNALATLDHTSGWAREGLAWLCVEALEGNVEADYACELVRRLGLFPAEEPVLVERWPWRVQISTLGRFEVRLDGERLDLGRSGQPTPLRLLKAIVAARGFGGGTAPADQVIGHVWPHLEGDAGARALDTTLHRLRRILRHDDAVELRRGRLALGARWCWVDVWALEKLAAGGGASVERILTLYQGPFLYREPGAAWVEPTRRRARSLFVRAVLAAGRGLAESGELARAADLYRRALAADSEAEPLRAALVEAELRTTGSAGTGMAAH